MGGEKSLQHTTVVSLRMPDASLARARVIRKIFHVTLHQIVRDGFELRLEQLEKKHEDELARLKTQRELHSRRVPEIKIGRLDLRTPMTDRPRKPVESSEETFYKRMAMPILKVGKDSRAIQRAATAAIEQVKKERPLSHPPDDEIIQQLEKAVVALREQYPVHTVDDIVGSIIAVDKVKTRGLDVDGEDDVA